MIELSIFKAFCLSKDTYQSYHKFINLSYIKTNFKELNKLYNTITYIYHHYSNPSISQEELESVYVTNYPVLKETDRKELQELIGRVFASTVHDSILETLLESHRIRSAAGELAVTALRVSEGQDPTKLLEACSAFGDVKPIEVEVDLVTDDLAALYKTTMGGDGIHLPLKCLRESLGPLRKGNFGVVFARPETGKTTFMAQVATYAAPQVERPILWWNNEQAGEEVKLRLYQAAFGVSIKELFADMPKYQELYQQVTKGLLYLLDYDILDVKLIERVCEQYNPSLIIIDQLDKVEGFKEDRHDLTLGAGYIWARKLAKRYCPVIGVSQASDSGEGVKYLTRSHMADSRTAKPAEADWLLGIGESSTDDFRGYRYFNISKNKLLGDENTKAELRHGRFQVVLEAELAHYKEI